LAVTVVRKPIRHLYLRVQGDGISVSAPLRATDAQIRDAVRGRRAWIQKHLARLRSRQEAQDQVAARGQVMLWGRAVPVEDGGAGAWRVELREEAVVVRAPSRATASARQGAVERFLRRELYDEIARLIPLWQAKMGVSAAGFRLRAMTSRWGSCNIRTGWITFNTELAHRDPALLEYVVVHELAHLIEAGHGPRFQAVMDAHLPGWHTRRKALNAG